MADLIMRVEEGLRRRGLGGEAKFWGMAWACNTSEP